MLPPKKTEMSPPPPVVDEAEFEESDIVDVRARSFPAGSNFFDQGFQSQFGEDDDDWEDEDDEDNEDLDDGHGTEPECRQQ
jgi:DnaJ family protein A protein 2